MDRQRPNPASRAARAEALSGREGLGYVARVTEEPTAQSEAETDPLLAPLNEHQRQAVKHGDGPLLVLAGAGSGKTRVITHRVAWLVERRGVAPWHILAVTFTNKAAGEMRERLERLLGPAGAEVQVSTFHAAGATLLRREAERVGLTRSFVIYDDSDQLQLIRRAMKEEGVFEDIKPKTVRQRIDDAKNRAWLPEDLAVGTHDRVGQAVRRVYARYQRLLRAANAVDFGDLLLELVLLFKRHPDVLERYRRRFEYVLVDEFQDTNPVQYELLKLLCPKSRANLCVVGDDDQSIYRWRGADPSNILSFERDFPGAETVKLERNYRSDAGILDAAYAVISKNARRKEKRLWTDRPKGEPLRILFAPDERAEAQLVAAQARELASQGVPYSEIAIFYRVNAQSRVVEEAMRLSGLPYRVVRGRAFYDRAEIKDAAAYLRLAVNPRSDADLERVINTPARGIGATTIERLRGFAQSEELSLYEALAHAGHVPGLNAGAQRRLRAFRDLVDALSSEAAAAGEAGTAVERIVEKSGLIAALVAEQTKEADERTENLREFIGAAFEYDRLHAAGELVGAEGSEEGPLKLAQTPLEAFLEQISLVGDADSEDDSGRVSLMTLHAAKGLEFDAVFMTGMEESVFPHSRALGGESGGVDPEELAEERRLCYVGITRARKRLWFTLAQQRALFGNLQLNDPSRFLADVPRELFDLGAPAAAVQAERHEPGELYVEREDEVDLGDDDGFVVTDEFDQRPEWERRRELERKAQKPPEPLRRRPEVAVPTVGARVRHEQFGDGLVVGSAGGGGPNASVRVRFPGLGERKIVARFLKPL
ncbi:MAG TPA: AAA family ATPase [Myxococcales bacterium]|nr:AAA family ATPase [Myxococcales bacterium]